MTSDLLALSRAEQEIAKSLLTWRVRAHGLTFVAVVGSLALVEPWVFVVAVGALGAEAGAWFLRYSASERHELAEEARRRAVLISELGTDPDALDTARILTKFSSSARSIAGEWADTEYFATDDSVGAGRLRESLQESAFWSAHLYQAAARQWWRYLGVVALIITLLVILVLTLETPSVAAATARGLTVALSVLIASDALGTALTYGRAGVTAERASNRLDSIRPSDMGSLLAVYGDYSTATALAPPIPTKLYRRCHDTIDAAWRGLQCS